MNTTSRKAAVIGGGVIGSSWAVNFSIKGFEVNLFNVRASRLRSAEEYVRSSVKNLREYGILSEDAVSQALKRIQYTTSLRDAVSDVEFIQECIPDKLDMKQEMLAEIEACCPDDAIIASSTSNLLISDIAKDANHPERCIGGHPFNPPHLIPLVEVSCGEKTSGAFLQKAVSFYRECGKAPAVLRKESVGFIANRLQMALFREAVDLVRKGVCSVADVDAAVTYGPGLRWAALGPHMAYELGGGPGGFKGLLTALQAGGDVLLKNLADWKSMPMDYLDVGQEGVYAEMEGYSNVIGHNTKDIAAFRDKVLITLLKAHELI